MALNTNSILWFIGSIRFQGITQTSQNLSVFALPSVTHVLNHTRYPCLEPGPARKQSRPFILTVSTNERHPLTLALSPKGEREPRSADASTVSPDLGFMVAMRARSARSLATNGGSEKRQQAGALHTLARLPNASGYPHGIGARGFKGAKCYSAKSFPEPVTKEGITLKRPEVRAPSRALVIVPDCAR